MSFKAWLDRYLYARKRHDMLSRSRLIRSSFTLGFQWLAQRVGHALAAATGKPVAKNALTRPWLFGMSSGDVSHARVFHNWRIDVSFGIDTCGFQSCSILSLGYGIQWSPLNAMMKSCLRRQIGFTSPAWVFRSSAVGSRSIAELRIDIGHVSHGREH